MAVDASEAGNAWLFPSPGKWTEAHYFNLPETQRLVELSNGNLIITQSPCHSHQRAVATLSYAVVRYVRQEGLGRVIAGELPVRLKAGCIRKPDLMFLSVHNCASCEFDLYVDGAPDWVCEVIASDTRHTDEVVKLTEYAEAGIPIYCLVDPDHKALHVYHLDGAAYALKRSFRPGDQLTCQVFPGFSLAVDELF